MAVYRRSTRTRYVLAVLVLAALTMVTVDARSNGGGVLSDARTWVADGFSPLQRATHAVLRPVGDFLTGALDYGSLRRENQRLREEVASLQKQSVQAAADEAAAQQILSEQGLPFVGGQPTVTVQVIDDGPSNFENTVTVDKGTADGLAPGQPVVAAGGLVGSVLAAGSHIATVVLLTDPTFSVGVALQGGNVGSAQGLGRAQPLRVAVFSTNQAPPKMKPGETVVTSGLDMEKFLPGIPVGRVDTFSSPPGASEPTITLHPLADLDHLVYLQVVLWSPP